MKKIKIIQAIRQGKIGGGESHVLDLVKHMDKSRFEPIVLSFTEGQMMDRLDAIGIENYVIHTERPFDFSKWQEVKKLMKEKEIDIVHAHGTRAGTNVFWPARRLGKPLLYTVHGWSFHDDQQVLVKRIRVAIEKYLTGKTDLNISVSQSNQDTGKHYFSGFRSKVINNGIDLERFDPLLNYADIRSEFGVEDHAVLIGYIARITKQKDPFTLLKAFKKVSLIHDEAKLFVVGDGELKEEAEALCATLGLNDKVIFAGYRTDVPHLLNAFDIYCLPSLWEGLPIGLMEAMAMKKAVVATEVDGTRELLMHGENGYVVKPKDIDAMAEYLGKLVVGEKLRRDVGHHARATIEKNFNIKAMVRETEEAYLSLL